VDNYIFLASGTGNKIYEFTEAGGAGTTASWTTSLSNPSGLAYDPNWGWIFAANKGSSAITAYNTSGAAQSLSGFSVSSPTAMVFDSHSKTFYVLTSTGMKAFTETSTTGTVSAASLSGTFPNLNTPTEMILVP
jgi:DNA-binding beta-propeller fold protein YncE